MQVFGGDNQQSGSPCASVSLPLKEKHSFKGQAMEEALKRGEVILLGFEYNIK